MKEPEHYIEALDECRPSFSGALDAHQQQRGRKKLRDQYMVTRGSLVIPAVFVYLLLYFGFDSLPVLAAPRFHARSVEERRKAVKPDEVTQIVVAGQ